MSVLDWLNKLAAEGLLLPLYNASVVTVRAYQYRELELYRQSLAALPKFADDPAECARRTAEACGVDLSTVYKARREMDKPVGTGGLGR